MGFAETKTGQILIHRSRKVQDRGLQLVILLYGIAKANRTATIIVFAALLFLSGLLVANLDSFLAFLKKITAGAL